MINHGQVGDGLCDCCDGTDEWETGAGDLKHVLLNMREMAFIVHNALCSCTLYITITPVCENTCNELGRAAREARQAELKAALEGFNIR